MIVNSLMNNKGAIVGTQFKQVIAIVGGTGDLGGGLARRFARAGFRVLIGSRNQAAADESSADLKALAATYDWGDIDIEGMDNPSAARLGDIVFVTVPFSAQSATLKSIAAEVQGKIVIDVTVPLVPPRVARVQLPAGGSAGQIAQHLLGDSVHVVSALQNVAAAHLNSDDAVECDVLVTGDNKDARQVVVDLLAAIDLQGFHAGPIDNAAAAEALTSVLINLNKQYKTHAGIKITGIR